MEVGVRVRRAGRESDSATCLGVGFLSPLVLPGHTPAQGLCQHTWTKIPEGSHDRKSGVCGSLTGSWSGRWKPRVALERGQRAEALRRRQELLGKRGIVSL